MTGLVKNNFSNSENTRLYAEGFLSYIKGCNRLDFSSSNGTSGRYKISLYYGYKTLTLCRSSFIFQESINPSVYTKLSCFLPWIAEQYDMDFPHNIEDGNQECTRGSGDINDYNSDTCRCNCPGEDLLIFPFYWNGKLFDQCVFLEENEFLFPVARAPTRNITRKLNGINSFVYADYVKQV